MQQGHEFFNRNRSAEKVALVNMASQLIKAGALRFVFHAFGDNGQA